MSIVVGIHNPERIITGTTYDNGTSGGGIAIIRDRSVGGGEFTLTFNTLEAARLWCVAALVAVTDQITTVEV